MSSPKIPSVPFLKLGYHAIGLLRNPIKEITGMTKTYGDIFAFGDINYFSKHSSKPAIFIHHPDYIKHVLKDNQANYSRGIVFKKRKDLASIDEFLGNGIFMSDGADWEAQHKMIRSLFSGESLEKTHTVIEKETKLLIKEWQEKIELTNELDIETSIHYRMLKILFKSHIITADDFDYLAIFNTFQNIMKAASFKESVGNFIKIGFLRAIGIKKKPVEHETYIEHLDGLVKKLVERLQQQPTECGALTRLLLEKYNAGEITYTDLRDTIMNFIFAGFETTAAAITWTLYCMAKYPQEQEKVAKEVIAKNINPAIHWQHIDLPYLNFFIKESMRLYPPVWFYIRESLADDYMGDKFIPKGSFVIICPFALHQHKDFWKDPALFNPKRFEKQQIQGKAFVYIPFGQGKRMCIGHAFAGIQMHMILADLISHFKFEKVTKKEPVINPAIIIKGARPVRLKVHNR